MFDRYNISDERDLKAAGLKMQTYLEQKAKVITEVDTKKQKTAASKSSKGLSIQ
jgi:hypothetical protein